MTDTTDHPPRRAGLRDEIAQALEAADYRLDMRRGDLADAIMPVLYREWPWLRAEAEEAAASVVVPAADRAAPELTAEEARALAEDLGYQLYRAQDALAFVGECCDLADREQRPVTTADVREWLKGARCGRQLVAEVADRAALRDRIAEAVQRCAEEGNVRYQHIAEAALSVLPAPADRAAVLEEAADAPAAECSAQNRNYESGPRLCIRAAQHHGDHIDEHGFHWSDSVAVYPVADGTFRKGVNLGALRLAVESAVVDRVAAETPPAETGCAHCGKPVRRITGTLAAWWVHDPDGHTACHPQEAAASTRATPGPVPPAQPGQPQR